LHRNRGQLLDALDRDAAEMEELEDRAAGLRHGEERTCGHRQYGERDHEGAARNEAPANGGLADPAQDALLEFGLDGPVKTPAQVAQSKLELRHTTPPPSARAGARARATAWT